MSLALPVTTQFDNRQYRCTCSMASVAENNLGDSITTADSGHLSAFEVCSDRDQLCQCYEARHVMKLPHDAVPIVGADAKSINQSFAMAPPPSDVQGRLTIKIANEKCSE